MTINEHAEVFHDRAIINYKINGGIHEADEKAYRLALSWDEADKGASILDLVNSFVKEDNVGNVSHLVIGCWGEPYENSADELISLLVKEASKFTKLEALFVGDIIMEESEMSWIEQGSYVELLKALPNLKHLKIRGGTDLTLGVHEHDNLQSLIIETGGLSNSIIEDIVASSYPALTHLELWLGSEEYGFDIEFAMIEKMLTKSWPNLTYLGLCNCDVIDELIVVVLKSPILQQLKVLDISKGNLSNSGAEHILLSKNILNLERLDMHHHFMSDAMMKRMTELPIEIDVSNQQEEDKYGDEIYRYIFVAE